MNIRVVRAKHDVERCLAQPDVVKGDDFRLDLALLLALRPVHNQQRERPETHISHGVETGEGVWTGGGWKRGVVGWCWVVGECVGEHRG